jgi:hypothetical protein
MEQDLVIPTYQSQASEENYEGATVIDPIKGRLSQTVHNFSLTSFFQLASVYKFVPVKPVLYVPVCLGPRLFSVFGFFS